jgi:site-specific DNA-methyltransferase (adenine-specific)
MYKARWEKMRKGESDVTRDEFIQWTNSVWNFGGERALSNLRLTD